MVEKNINMYKKYNLSIEIELENIFKNKYNTSERLQTSQKTPM